MKQQPPINDGRAPSAEALQAGQPRDAMQELAEDAIRILGEITYKDCWGDSGTHEGEECDCEPCVANRAVDVLRSLAEPVVRSIHENRNFGPERVYFDRWVDENTRRSGINYGVTLIEGILATKYDVGIMGTGAPIRPFVSQRDMDVATAVVQWLGTNCGRAMVQACEQEIERQSMERRDSQTAGWFSSHYDFPQGKDRDRIESVARQIANESSATDEQRKRIAGQLCKAMKWAWQSGRIEALEEGIGKENVGNV